MLWPSRAEQASVQFSLGGGGYLWRYAAGLFLFATGSAVAIELHLLGGLALIALGHIIVWVRGQTLAPGGATPSYKVAWAPADASWYDRVEELEAAGARWDASAWDISSGIGFVALFGVVIAWIAALIFIDLPHAGRLTILAAALFLPVWFNGMRRVWNPSELHLVGRALDVARKVVANEAANDYEIVPLLGLTDGEHGNYPVDARLMLRPTSGADGRFIGIQIQVSMNNVQGTDYPYLYCVVLAKDWSALPDVESTDVIVRERDSGEDVVYIVVRQYADNSGGWHTEPEHIVTIVREALAIGKQVKR